MIEDVPQLLRPVYQLAVDAGHAIMQLYQQNDPTIEIKADNSPVTAADLKANKIIVAGLQQLTPDIPILSEEFVAISYEQRQAWQQYWLIDPLDGTKEYIERTGEFTVNIALIENHQPVLGVVYAPALQAGYEACRGCGAFKRSADGTYDFIQVRPKPEDHVVITVSRRHSKASRDLFQRMGNYELIHRGSALKICFVAEGKADVYPRFGPTSEWDTAAGQCVLAEAGGRLMDFKGETFQYNTKASTLNPEFIAVGDTQHDWLNYLAA